MKPLNLRSIGLRSDFMFHCPSVAEIADKGDFLAVKTPGHPDYFWGNYLVFDRAPSRDDWRSWEREFEEAFRGQPAEHRAFTWDVTDTVRPPASPEVVESFLEGGYDYSETVVLVMRRLEPPPHPNYSCVYRQITSDADWEKAVELQTLCGRETFAELGYTDGEIRAFVLRTLVVRRELVAKGAGLWMGAFDGDELVADAGLFWENGIGRFQSVETKSERRRQGICATLIHRASMLAFDELGLRALVIETDHDGPAPTVYKSVGFREVERLGSFLRAPKVG